MSKDFGKIENAEMKRSPVEKQNHTYSSLQIGYYAIRTEYALV